MISLKTQLDPYGYFQTGYWELEVVVSPYVLRGRSLLQWFCDLVTLYAYRQHCIWLFIWISRISSGHWC